MSSMVINPWRLYLDYYKSRIKVASLALALVKQLNSKHKEKLITLGRLCRFFDGSIWFLCIHYPQWSSVPTLANLQQANSKTAEVFLKYISSDKISW